MITEALQTCIESLKNRHENLKSWWVTGLACSTLIYPFEILAGVSVVIPWNVHRIVVNVFSILWYKLKQLIWHYYGLAYNIITSETHLIQKNHHLAFLLLHNWGICAWVVYNTRCYSESGNRYQKKYFIPKFEWLRKMEKKILNIGRIGKLTLEKLTTSFEQKAQSIIAIGVIHFLLTSNLGVQSYFTAWAEFDTYWQTKKESNSSLKWPLRPSFLHYIIVFS